MLNWVLERQTATLWAAVGTLALGSAVVYFRSEGFFPMQDTGVIQGISEARSRSPLPPWRSASSRSPRSSGGPAVESVSSFIGVDGTNTTLNSGPAC